MVLRKLSHALALAPLLLTGAVAEAHQSGHHAGPFLQFEFGEYRYPEPAWAAGGISCRGGSRIVYNRGFDAVRPLKCSGRIFTYEGEWFGDILRVHVDSRTGRILGVTG